MKESYISDLYVFEEKGKPGRREEQVQEKKGRGICTCFVKEWMKRQEVEGLCFQRFKANIWIETQGEPSGFQKGMQIRCGEASLEIRLGKSRCFQECARVQKGLPCLLKKECWYAVSLSDGRIRTGDCVNY